MLVDFYTIKVENIKSRLVSHARRTEGIHSDEANEMDLETNENGTHNPQPTQHEEVLDVTVSRKTLYLMIKIIYKYAD